MDEFVFDYAAGTPWVVTDPIEDAIERADEQGESIPEAIARETTRQYRSDAAFRTAFRDCYQEAGVDVASVTISGAPPRNGLLRWQARFDADPNLRKILSPADARAVADSDDVGILLNTQNLGRDIGDDPREIDALWNAGVRIFQPTYNLQNALGAGCYERSGSGLSNAGVEAVERIQELGGIVDFSHCGKETTLDGIEVAEKPVACTHVSCEVIADHPRAKSDEELRALAEADGYVGIVGVPWFLAPDEDDPGLEVFVEHVAHAVDVVGADRVGIGTDFGNVDTGAPDRYVAEARERAVAAGFPEGYGEGYGGGFGEMRRYGDWPKLREVLAGEFDEEVVEGILGRNFLAFWERVGGG